MLEVRKKLKAKKPNFLRHDWDKGGKLKTKWVRPKGPQNKMRKRRRGHRNLVSVGYGSPKEVKGLNKEGKRFVNILNVAGLEKVDVAKDIIYLGKNVGKKNKIVICEAAKAKNITIANIKDVNKFLDDIKKEREAKKAKSLTKKEERQKKKEETLKKAEENKKKEENEEKKETLKEEGKPVVKEEPKTKETKPKVKKKIEKPQIGVHTDVEKEEKVAQDLLKKVQEKKIAEDKK